MNNERTRSLPLVLVGEIRANGRHTICGNSRISTTLGLSDGACSRRRLFAASDCDALERGIMVPMQAIDGDSVLACSLKGAVEVQHDDVIGLVLAIKQ